jgi:hypothetical protein
MAQKGKGEGHEHSVGYKRPPRHTQFKPGQSGNPNGRPRRVPTVDQVFLKELQSRISVTTGGTKRSMSKLQAIAKQFFNKALSGDQKAARFVLEWANAGKANSGDNLESLIQEFRALHSRYQTADIKCAPSGEEKDEQDS